MVGKFDLILCAIIKSITSQSFKFKVSLCGEILSSQYSKLHAMF
jgi:hypothetical protein